MTDPSSPDSAPRWKRRGKLSAIGRATSPALDYPIIVENVRRLLSRPELSGRTTLIVDATGVGRPVVDLLRRAQLPCRLMPVTITAGDRETAESGTWRVPKRDLITGSLGLLQREKIDICGHLSESETLSMS
jgi:hypothetical protein